MRGHLYVLTNPHMPGLVKIGCTERTAYERADELSRATGVPGRFRVERSWSLDDAAAAERRVHGALRLYRVSGEHFRLPVTAAIDHIEAMLPNQGKPQPAWLRRVERVAAVVLLIIACWPTLRRLPYRYVQIAARALQTLLRPR
jgi:hypothetical protein